MNFSNWVTAGFKKRFSSHRFGRYQCFSWFAFLPFLWNVRPYYLSLIFCNQKCYFRKRCKVSGLLCAGTLQMETESQERFTRGVYTPGKMIMLWTDCRWSCSGWVGRRGNKFFSVVIIFLSCSFEVYLYAVPQYEVVI